MHGGWLYKIMLEHTVLRGEVGSILRTTPHFLSPILDMRGGIGVGDILCKSLTRLEYEKQKKVPTLACSV